jgi:thiol-disulfide isomerase/thioredoxin
LLIVSTITAKECFVTLSTQNFTQLVDHSPDTWLLIFTDEKCGYCKDLLPLWKEAAEKLCNEPNLNLGVVDLRSNSDLRYRFEINNALAFKLIKNGYVYSFDSSYPVQNLIDFSQRGSAVLTGEVIPSYKSSVRKAWYIVKSSIEELLPICDNDYLKDFPGWVKVLLLILLLFSPVMLAAILVWYLSSPTITGEEEEEINPTTLSAMKIQAKQRRK